MSVLARVLALVGSLLLLVTAAYHGSGTKGLSTMLAGSSLAAEWVRALSGVWLFFSWHLVVLAVPPLIACGTAARALRPAVLFCGVVALGDFLWVLRLAGWFPGTMILLLAALCLLAAGLQRLSSPTVRV